MRRVPDAFLLNMAEVTATLIIGLFLVGVFFYVETGSGDGIARARSSRPGRGRASRLTDVPVHA